MTDHVIVGRKRKRRNRLLFYLLPFTAKVKTNVAARQVSPMAPIPCQEGGV